MKVIKEFPATEPIVSMIEFNGRILVATSKHVFRLTDNDQFEPLEFIAPTDDDAPGQCERDTK